MKAKLTAFIVAIVLFIAVVFKGVGAEQPVAPAPAPTATYVASDGERKVYLYDGVPCTNQHALSIILPSNLDDGWQAGRIEMNQHTYELCWVRVGEHVFAPVVLSPEAVIPGHAFWEDFKQDFGI